MRWGHGYSREQDLIEPKTIGGADDGTDIVAAPDVVEQDAQRHPLLGAEHIGRQSVQFGNGKFSDHNEASPGGYPGDAKVVAIVKGLFENDVVRKTRIHTLFALNHLASVKQCLCVAGIQTGRF